MPPPVFSWAGFYFGANLGVGVPLNRGESLQAVSGFSGAAFNLYPGSNERTGATFGAQLGYNWQHDRLVYGFETELNLLDGRRAPAGASATPPAPLGVFSYTLSSQPGGSYFGSLRGRLGVALDRTLFYVTGGIASGGWRGISTLTLNGGGALNPFVSGETASSRAKYIVGAGAEYALDFNWSARAEYLYLNQSFGTQVFDNGAGFDFASKHLAESHIFRLGLNYRLLDGALTPPSEVSARATANEGVGEAENAQGKPRAEAAPETYSVHGQATVLPQGYPRIRAKYSGPNSLPASGQVRSTVSVTGFLGLRLWEGGEAYVNPEIDEGYGVGNTFGVAGYPSAEAFKVGHARPYLRFQRYFVRQTIGLGGDSEQVDPGQNLMAGKVDANRLILTIGKYTPVDIFDDNKYAHDGRSGFMNWSIIDMGAFDYASDAWSYTHGATAEWKQDWWTARAGVFQLSNVPGGETIEPEVFRQWSPIVEFEARHSLLFGQQGKLKLLAYADIGYMGKFDEALEMAFLTGSTPDLTQDRKKRAKAGGGVNIEQPISDDLGFFLRASMANGRYETFDFTDIDRSLSGGFVLQGARWDRPNDAIGIAGVVNGISNSRANYLAAGGLGLLIGDGGLSYGGEHILETYYKYNIAQGVAITADYQFVQNPAYNKARGPVSLFAVRLHGEF